MFGWAKPVPVSAWQFRDPRRGMALVAAAGPAMNFFLAWLAALLLHGDGRRHRLRVSGAAGRIRSSALFLFYFILANLVLGLFNLLPIPPLDGGRIAVGLLPRAAGARLGAAGARRHPDRDPAGVPAAAAAGEFGVRFDPFGEALNTVVPWALDLVLRLAGPRCRRGLAMSGI